MPLPFNSLQNLDQIREALTTIKTTTGYNYLSKIQKKQVKVCLIHQYRLEYAKTHPDTLWQYFRSWNLIMTWNCHSSVYWIENEYSFSHRCFDPPIVFYNQNYLPNRVIDLSQVETEIRKYKTPQIIHIAKYTSQPRPHHSLIYLGLDSNKNIVFWEKQGNGLPYRLTDTKTVLDYYTNMYWSIRPLKTITERKI